LGTRYKGKAAEVRALDTYIKLMRASQSVSSRIERRLDDLDLTINQFGVLEALHHLGPMCQRALGEKLLTSGGNITMVVDNLERRKLVRRERDATDRRYITVHLLPEGRALIEKIFPGHVARITDEMSALGAGEQEELQRLLKKLGRPE
jgi:MarR family transcriptional regulator, 2-MHQ and catechol-resistance regulon repressor